MGPQSRTNFIIITLLTVGQAGKKGSEGSRGSAAEPDLRTGCRRLGTANTLSQLKISASLLVAVSEYWSRDGRARNFLHPFFPIIPCPPYFNPFIR